MSGKASSKLKILYLTDIFKQKTDENNILSACEICSILEKEYGIKCERKSIYSDIEILKNYGMDIVSSTSPKRGYFLASRNLETPEVRLLIDAVQAAGFITPKKTKKLIDKIKNETSIFQARCIEQQVYVDNRIKCKNEEIYYNIDLLNYAIDNNRQVKLTYLRHKINNNNKQIREEKVLKVNPYALIWSNDHYYLVGNNPKYDNLMHLRLDRMKKVTVLDEEARHYSEVCEFKEKFDCALYSSRMFNMFSGKVESVEIICDNSIIEEILDRFGENCILKINNEKQFTVLTKTVVSNGLVSWIMQFGENIQVSYPEKLKQHIIEKSQEILNLYR